MKWIFAAMVTLFLMAPAQAQMWDQSLNLTISADTPPPLACTAEEGWRRLEHDGVTGWLCMVPGIQILLGTYDGADVAYMRSEVPIQSGLLSEVLTQIDELIGMGCMANQDQEFFAMCANGRSYMGMTDDRSLTFAAWDIGFPIGAIGDLLQ